MHRMHEAANRLYDKVVSPTNVSHENQQAAAIAYAGACVGIGLTMLAGAVTTGIQVLQAAADQYADVGGKLEELRKLIGEQE